MEPVPPKKTKERPFYEPPSDKQIPVQIINEARLSLKDIKTKRPFTPRDERRTLFAQRSLTNPDNRPPSAFSLDSRHFDGADSRPVSGTRLPSLEHKPTCVPLEEEQPRVPSEADLENLLPPKPPSDPNKVVRKSSSRTRLHHANSVDASVSGGDNTFKTRSNSLTDVTTESGKTSDTVPEAPRRIHSGPKERTPLPVEERGEGDGRESVPHRAPSSAAVRSPPTSASRRQEAEERVGSGGTKRTSSAGNRTENGERVGSGGTKRTSSAGSRGGSAGKREEDSQEDEQYYKQHIVPALEEMAAYGKKKDIKKICELSDSLYSILERRNILGKTYKQRSKILKAIFKMLDLEEPRILLRLARLILAFKVSGNNLLNVCKLVFKVSRNEKNDPAFLEGNILELLLETLQNTDPATSHDALIYCIGALKFLSGNSTIAKQLVKKDCVERLATLLASINKTNRENGKPSEQLGNILVQLTAALRNLADANTSRDRLLQSRVVESLCVITDMYCSDTDLMLNISRIFSKVTLHTDCCLALAELPVSYKNFLQLLKRHLQREDIVVRVCFILGNMTAKNDDARLRLYQETKSMEILLSVLKNYLELDIKSRNKEEKKDSHRGEGDDGKALNKNEDVLIKVVRVLANVAINEEAGPQVASNSHCLELLLSIIDCKEIETSEELVLNTVATINNLSYYNCKTSAVTAHQMKVVDSLLKLVLSDNMEAMVEVARVFGNLTRQKQVRDYLTEKKVDVLLITLLDSGNREVVYIACGVLINFMVDEEKRQMLKSEGGITKLVEVLRDFGKSDWELAAMVCQTLWNYSGKITSTNDFFGEREAQELSELLIDFLDRESAFDSELTDDVDEEWKEFVVYTWESQFCPVGEQLLQRLESHQSDFEPLDNPSGS